MKSRIFIFIFLLTLYSCRKDERVQTIEQVVKEWTGKTVLFPEDVSCKMMGRDTVVPELFQRPYKILLYVDSMGCTSCKLRMPEWKKIIREADSIAPGQIGFLFYFNPKSSKELEFLLKRDHFDYPVFIDNENHIGKKNHFPNDISFQSFLLDKNNRVLAIGNPSMNPRVWELYKQQITGTKPVDNERKTSVELAASGIVIEGLEVGQVSHAVFVLKNTGNVPLVIHDIKSSCGCTIPLWERAPVKPGEETRIRVEIKPEEPGYLRKTIEVYGNVPENISLIVSGTVK